MDFPTRLKTYRSKKGLTQNQLAKSIGVSLGTVRNWEQGVNVPKYPAMKTISEVLDISVEELSGLNDFEGLDKNNKLAHFQNVINSMGGFDFSFVSIQVSQDKVLNGMYQKLLDFGYLVEAMDNGFRILNRTSGNIYFLSTQEVKDLHEDAENYLKSRLEALEQKLKGEGRRE